MGFLCFMPFVCKQRVVIVPMVDHRQCDDFTLLAYVLSYSAWVGMWVQFGNQGSVVLNCSCVILALDYIFCCICTLTWIHLWIKNCSRMIYMYTCTIWSRLCWKWNYMVDNDTNSFCEISPHQNIEYIHVYTGNIYFLSFLHFLVM